MIKQQPEAEWLQFTGRRWLSPTPPLGEHLDHRHVTVRRKIPVLAWGAGHKSPPSVAATSEPPPHSLKNIPEREILFLPDGKHICGRRLSIQKANGLELAKL